VLAAARIYGAIGRKVRDAGPEGLDHRISTSKPEKLQAVSVALTETLSRNQRWPLPGPQREGLWTRPR
jgi:phytoene synthase